MPDYKAKTRDLLNYAFRGLAQHSPLLKAVPLALLACACANPTAKVTDSPADAAPIDLPYPSSEVPPAEEPVLLRQDAPLVYVVKPGDTLWDIAKRYLKDPWQWPQLWYVNDQIRNPHLIYPGDQLTLIWVNGQPRLGFDATTERRSPQIRTESLDSAIPTVPISAIRNFLHHPQLATAEELRKAPYIVEFSEEHIIAGSNSGIYVKGLTASAPDWAVVEQGRAYVDPDTHKVLGVEAIPVGDAHLEEPGKVAKMSLTNSEREVRIGDRLLPLETEGFNANFFPHKPLQPVNGKIISVFNGLAEIPEFQVVVLNRGEKDGLDPGAVLSIMQAGRLVADPMSATGHVQLPDESAGTMMVFKTTPGLSFAIVLNITRPVHVLDKFVPPKRIR